jgi:chromosomal replication initiator protein
LTITPASGVASSASDQSDSPVAAAWEQIRAGLRRDCGARTFDGWLRPITLGAYDQDSGTVALELPSQFMADWVHTHFADRLALAWRSLLPSVRQVSIRAGGDGTRSAPTLAEIPQAEAEAAPAPTAKGQYPAQLEPRYRFENFVVGKANEVAFNAARTLAAADQVAFNPLFIHGGTGRGKTHLLHAIGHHFRALRPGRGSSTCRPRSSWSSSSRRFARTTPSSSSSSSAPPTC